MNFFEHQARARRATTYRVALLTLVALSPSLLWLLLTTWLDETSWVGALVIFCLMIPFIAGGYWYEIRKLKRGGSAIAEQLGGELISHNPDEHEERLLEIVEEMAIASGSTVPLVYVLDKRGINAFAAGATPRDSVIGVSYGALLVLNREELQAVIAHLFSQIHRSDMRMDARMNGVAIGCGWVITLSVLGGGGSAISGILLLLGCGWMQLYARVMARAHRQRKFLADASAAQFTRNPLSVASALKKIASHEDESWVLDCREEDYLQIFFAAAQRHPEHRARTPYPSLEDRIRRIDPDWDGEYLCIPELESLLGDDKHAQENRRRWKVLGAVANVVSTLKHAEQTSSATALYQTRAALDKIPQAVRTAGRHPSGAQALIYRLLLSPQIEQRERQLTLLRNFIDKEVDSYLRRLEAPMANLDLYLRLPLIDLCIPALKQLKTQHYRIFRTNLTLLIETDGRKDTLEWTLLHILELHLRGKPKVKSRYRLEQRADDVALLLILLAFMGHKSVAHAERAYYRASDALPYYPPPLKGRTRDRGLDDFAEALDNLRQLYPQDKQTLLEIMAVCIKDDGHITPEEIEILRATADILGCSMPEELQMPSLHTLTEETIA